MARTTETAYRFTQLALGRHTLTVRAAKCVGAAVRSGIGIVPGIAAPVALSRIELTPGYFQITATPHRLAVMIRRYSLSSGFLGKTDTGYQAG